MVTGRIGFALIALSIAAAPAYAQSLAELARQEESRRATSKSVKTLSNANLDPADIVSPASPDSPASPASPESCYMSKSLGRCVTADQMLKISNEGVATKENAPYEQQWRQDSSELRTQIEQTQGLIETLERVSVDGSRSMGERRSAAQSLTAARESLNSLERRWLKMESQAVAKKIPRAWISPIPTLSSRSQ